MRSAKETSLLQTADKVILFDGVCKLCHVWSRFIIRYDKAKKFKLASVQSREGVVLMDHYQLRIDEPEGEYKTMYYLDSGQIYQKSTAFLRIMATMPYPWRLLVIFKLIPRPARDFCYDFIASNRYTIFGKYSTCTLPHSDHEMRFLNIDRQ